MMDYDPVDWMWITHSDDWLWHLKKIKADLAWDITQGDSTVVTAVLDVPIDFSHPDLYSEVFPHYDPYQGTPYMHNTGHFHGTAVASFVSAETTKNGETQHGPLASVGFDTRMVTYNSVCDIRTFLRKALHSSTVMGADVLVSCAGASLGCYPNPNTGEDLVMKEILNNGTVIVMSAGNGYNSTSRSYCGDEFQATEHYPFNSSYDERVIVVTSTDSIDNHGHYIEGIDHTHSHFSTIDICAPGYDVMGAMPVHLEPDPTFPYYGNLNGTSFAAPIVAGACALIKSINKDFTPGEIQYFIKSTADPVNDEYLYHGMLGAGRLNVYGAVAMANNCTPGIVSANTYWTRDTTVVCGLEIMNGGCLTISSNVKLSKHSPIIVHAGGKLIVDGGSLTALDDIQWPGIQVWGNSSENQVLSHGVYKQGYLEMKNGATIENAVCAVDLWHPNYWSTSGGIIYATDAVFRNNAMAVHIPPYIAYFNSGTERDYNALFDNCTFTIDENYLGTATFYKHVDMNQVKGVKFLGCDFSVEANVTGVSENCLGIGAYGAGFMVDSYCTSNAAPCPDNQINHCTFSGFKKAVSSVSNGTTTRSYVIRDAIFTNNNIGVYSQNTGYATIVGNEFSIGRGAECCYGVYADGVTGFCIEENVFEQASGANGETYGIGVFNSQSVNDIYLNTFNGLTYGNLSYGTNHTADLQNRPPATITGLTYSCNDNSGNYIDFIVAKDNGAGGIANYQGASTLPAGNTFSGTLYHFYNNGEFNINYYYKLNGNNQVPNTSKLSGVNAYSTTSTNSCLSHYGNSRVIKSAAEKAALANIYQTAENARDRYMAAGDIVRSCINDSVGDLSEMRLWLGNINDLASDRMIVASYIQESDFASAMALANTFPAAYNLHDDGLSDHNDYMTLLNLYQTLYNTNRTVYNLTESELNTVKHIADNGSGTSKLMSEAILMELSDKYESQCMCVDILEGADRGSENQEELKAEEDDELIIEIAPIPATTWVTVAYTLPHEATKATMSIINSLGTTVMELELNGSQGVKRIDLRDMSNGVYSYIVRCGEHVKTGKLAVAR